MQWFRVDVKTFLGLAMPNQCCHLVTKLILGWFVGGIFRQEKSQTLMIPMYSTTVLYDDFWLGCTTGVLESFFMLHNQIVNLFVNVRVKSNIH